MPHVVPRIVPSLVPRFVPNIAPRIVANVVHFAPDVVPNEVVAGYRRKDVWRV